MKCKDCKYLVPIFNKNLDVKYYVCIRRNKVQVKKVKKERKEYLIVILPINPEKCSFYCLKGKLDEKED